MSRLRLTSQRFLFLRLLSLSLVVGALYDLSFAALMVLAPQLPAKILGLPLPGEAFYLWLMAVFLLMLAGLYILAAREPRRYSAVILVAIGGRFLGAVAFAAAAFGNPDLGGLYPLAAADLLFAIAHAAFWGPIRS
ncbi:MAG: hypothetical protein SX243_23760 [Acidobacteriota bacterium]|nr:hypothetical protein [Acidobacteriota bacterium]